MDGKGVPERYDQGQAVKSADEQPEKVLLKAFGKGTGLAKLLSVKGNVIP